MRLKRGETEWILNIMGMIGFKKKNIMGMTGKKERTALNNFYVSVNSTTKCNKFCPKTFLNDVIYFQL